MWQPLVVGPAAERARRCIEDIARALMSCEPERLFDAEAAAHHRSGSPIDDTAKLRQVSLSDGLAGIALFAARFAGRDAAWTNVLLDRAIHVGSCLSASP